MADYNPFSLQGKTVLITGASSGIGRATAIECSRMGATVVVTARNQERLQETYSRLEGGGHVQIVADLTKDEDVTRLAEEVPMLHGLVNNAGIGKTLPIQFFNKEDVCRVFDTNFLASTLLTKVLLKKKKLLKGGSLVFVSSISQYALEKGSAIYGSSKAAIEAYTKFAAQELASKKMRCNSVHPGMIDTPLIHHGTITEEQHALDMKKYPLGRYGTPVEVAHGIIYLLSDASSWMTGHSLVIDGGRTLR